MLRSRASLIPIPILRTFLGLAFLQLVLSIESRAATSLVISVPDQKMALLQDGLEVSRFQISTSKFGLGDNLGSYATPLGVLQIAKK
jgi:hypothetical protein